MFISHIYIRFQYYLYIDIKKNRKQIDWPDNTNDILHLKQMAQNMGIVNNWWWYCCHVCLEIIGPDCTLTLDAPWLLPKNIQKDVSYRTYFISFWLCPALLGNVWTMQIGRKIGGGVTLKPNILVWIKYRNVTGKRRFNDVMYKWKMSYMMAYKTGTRYKNTWKATLPCHDYVIVIRWWVLSKLRWWHNNIIKDYTFRKHYIFNRKCQYYVYIKWEYWSTM